MIGPRISDDGHAHIVTAIPEPVIVLTSEAGDTWTYQQWRAAARYADVTETVRGPCAIRFDGVTPHSRWRDAAHLTERQWAELIGGIPAGWTTTPTPWMRFTPDTPVTFTPHGGHP